MVWDRFRWVFCQLDTLCRCFPSSIRTALNELPTTLDDTYEQTLQGIPKEKRQHAYRLLQCLVAAIRPLRVQELAEIFTIEFDLDAGLKLVEEWRPENPEQAILSACSTLIVVIDDLDTKIVQFSHFTVKEFLTSDRLRLSRDVPHYHIRLNTAHTTLARICLAVLLQLDEEVDTEHLKRSPLAGYAAQYWVDHAQFEDVVLGIRDAMERLFHPRKAHFRTWIKIHDVIRRSRSRGLPGQLPHSGTPLYYAVFCGFTELAKYLIVTQKEDVNATCGRYGTPLHAASFKGHPDAARLLLDHGADVNSTCGGEVPLRIACRGRHLNIMDLLLKRGAKVDIRDDDYIGTILHRASWEGEVEALRVLLEHKANIHATSDTNLTPLDIAFFRGHAEVAQLLLEYEASSVLNPQVGAASRRLEPGGSPSDCVDDRGASHPKLPSLPVRSQDSIVMARPNDGAMLVCERPPGPPSVPFLCAPSPVCVPVQVAPRDLPSTSLNPHVQSTLAHNPGQIRGPVLQNSGYSVPASQGGRFCNPRLGTGGYSAPISRGGRIRNPFSQNGGYSGPASRLSRLRGSASNGVSSLGYLPPFWFEEY